MPVTTSDIAQGARTYLRDFPQYFEVDEGPLNVLTIRMPQPLIVASLLQVYLTPQPTTIEPEPVSALTTSWQLDDRNGLLKITDSAALGQRCLVAGYHVTWFSDSELEFHAGKVTNEMAHTGLTLNEMSSVEADVTMLGAVVSALWSLSIELSLDIDVSTPEGMFIPARQRFQQVMQMLQYYENEYATKSSMLNIGLNAIEQFRLRRVAYLTGRYVPVYREREFDDPRWPTRIYPPIPEGQAGASGSSVELVQYVEEVTW